MALGGSAAGDGHPSRAEQHSSPQPKRRPSMHTDLAGWFTGLTASGTRDRARSVDIRSNGKDAPSPTPVPMAARPPEAAPHGSMRSGFLSVDTSFTAGRSASMPQGTAAADLGLGLSLSPVAIKPDSLADASDESFLRGLGMGVGAGGAFSFASDSTDFFEVDDATSATDLGDLREQLDFIAQTPMHRGPRRTVPRVSARHLSPAAHAHAGQLVTQRSNKAYSLGNSFDSFSLASSSYAESFGSESERGPSSSPSVAFSEDTYDDETTPSEDGSRPTSGIFDISTTAAPPTPTASAPPTPTKLQAALWKFQPGVEQVIEGMEKSEIQRQEVIHEIITSEAAYVADLTAAVRLFHKPLEKFNVLSADELRLVFADLPLILQVNSKLLEKLTRWKAQEWPVYGDVAEQLLPFFMEVRDHYTSHCQQIKESTARVQQLMVTNGNFASFMAQLTRNEGVDVLGLQSYLIKPLQRITKYGLLLRELRKCTPEGHCSFANVAEAEDLINKALYDINEAQRELERRQQLVDIQNKLDLNGWPATHFAIVQDGRHLVKEGTIKVEQYRDGKRKDSKLHAFLFNNCLLLTKIKKRPERESWLQDGRTAVRRGSTPEAFSRMTPPPSPFAASSTSAFSTLYKVVCEPLNLSYAEKKTQDGLTVFELFSSYTMTMNVISVRLEGSRQSNADLECNDMWHPILEQTVDAVHAMDAARNAPKGSGDDGQDETSESDGTPGSGSQPFKTPRVAEGLNAVQAALWINQPGAKDVLDRITKEERMRQECIHETISTERGYVRDLERTLTIFHRPLNKFEVITPEESDQLFGDIQALHRHNAKLLEKLEQRQKEQWPLLEDITDILVPFFATLYKNYHRHCERIKDCSQKTTRLQATNPNFASFMAQLTQNEGVDVLGLQSYLIKPLQRITKYGLLMRELRKYTPEDHPSFTGVCEANRLVAEALESINEYTRYSEHRQQLQAIQASIDTTTEAGAQVAAQLVINGRHVSIFPNLHRAHLIRQGPVLVEIIQGKRSRKQIKDSYAFLFNDAMLFTKCKEVKRESKTSIMQARGRMRRYSKTSSVSSGSSSDSAKSPAPLPDKEHRVISPLLPLREAHKTNLMAGTLFMFPSPIPAHRLLELSYGMLVPFGDSSGAANAGWLPDLKAVVSKATWVHNEPPPLTR